MKPLSIFILAAAAAAALNLKPVRPLIEQQMELN
jgi:hypothetical protein